MNAAPQAVAPVAAGLQLLGPMTLVVGGQVQPLPRSKKTRALLAYLAGENRPQRRDRLCGLLWDATDDPRGALRWSLSRLRRVLCADDVDRLDADLTRVAVLADTLDVDAAALDRCHLAGFATIETAALEHVAVQVRGEFLEGLELPDCHDFHAWCIERRERVRRQHAELLAELVARHAGDPARALPFAVRRTQADPFGLAAHEALLRLLLSLGRVGEARQRFDHAQRLFRQVSAPDAIALDRAWRTLREAGPSVWADRSDAAGDGIPPAIAPAPSPSPSAPPVEPGVISPPAPATAALDRAAPPAFVGRARELARLEALLDEARGGGGTRVALVTGEPGIGKSRLAERVASAAVTAGFAVVSGRAFEAESSRPFGPWADALAVDLQQAVASNVMPSREALFDTLRTRLAALAERDQGVLVVFDDLQWLDRDSAALLHHVVRTYDRGPMVVLLLARDGELADNEGVTSTLRGLRRDRAVHTIALEPLSEDAIAALVGLPPDVDGRRVHAVSGGNPLYALEFVRASADGRDATPATLLQLVRERVARLPDAAADVLRWGSVLGHAIDLDLLEGLSGQRPDEVVDAMERLEQASLLRIDATRVRERYVFAHDLVREAVYGGLSQPRRRLMHRRVAQLLEPRAAEPSVAAELAHHAGLAGESLLGVRACIAAGQHALRVFALGDAETLARRGLRLAEELQDEAARVESTLDLLQVLFAARVPDREEAAARVRTLAERALDLGLTNAARQGFQTLSYLRWEGSSLADAHANILQAERVSRLAGPGERSVALAQAARCLVLLERNLPQAEAFVLEADAVARRDGRTSAAVAFALGMIAAHRGDAEAAEESFTEARDLARQRGEHLAEFGALEHHVMLELDRGRPEAAAALAEELVLLGDRVRPGAERVTSRALAALARVLGGDAAHAAALDAAVDAVRRADAKYELSFILSRGARWALAAGNEVRAGALADEALQVAHAMGRRSEQALALGVLAELALRRGRPDERLRLDERLTELTDSGALSAHSRAQLPSAMRERAIGR
jgi:DNA-binding SARP family transcriptional activator